MALQWKQHDVFKTAGSVVKVGKWQGANYDEMGNPIPSEFTLADIRKIHDNATEPIPIYVDLHGKGLDRRKPVGYAFRLGLSEDGTELAHNGFVFDIGAQRMISMGHDKVSPEITTVKDAKGNIVDRKLDGLCFVPHGAISDNELDIMVEKFSTPEGMAGDANAPNAGTPGNPTPALDINAIVAAAVKAATEASAVNTQKLIDEAVLKVGQNTQKPAEIPKQPEVIPPATTQNDSMNADLANMKTQFAAQQAVTDKLLNEKYEELVSQVKNLGIPDPSSIVSGLPKMQAIETLTGMKANLIQNASLSGVPRGLSGQNPGQNSEAQNYNECMHELGFNNPKYHAMFK